MWGYSTPFTPHLLSGSFPIQCLILVLYLNTSHSSLLPVGHFIVTLILAVQWYMLITGCHVAIHLFVSILLRHYQSDTGNYHPHFQSTFVYSIVRYPPIHLPDAGTYFSFVALKIWVSETLFPLDIPPSTVSKVELCPATYSAHPSHSICSPCNRRLCTKIKERVNN